MSGIKFSNTTPPAPGGMALVTFQADGLGNVSAAYTASGASSNSSLDVNQTTHGFAVNDAIYFTGSVWAKAKADASGTLGLGIVAVVTDADNFTVFFSGYVDTLSGFTGGQYYFVSDATAGLLTTTEPVSTSSFSNPLFFAITATTGVVLPFRPSAIQSIVTPTVTPVKTTNYSANAWETVLVDPTGAGFTVTLPLAATAGPAAEVTVTNVTTSTNLMTLARSGSDTINADTSATFSGAHASVTLFSDGGSGWWVE